MNPEPPAWTTPPDGVPARAPESGQEADNSALHVYLLGALDFDAVLALQRRLVYEVASDRKRGALILCEHPSLITVGRQGSRTHILCEAEELRARQWQVRWVNRGGGCLLHMPGQLAIYPVLALDRFSLTVPAYLDQFQSVLLALLADFSVLGTVCPGQPGVWVGDRLVANVGIAVREWVTYYGAVLNVNPALAPYRLVLPSAGAEPMTSLERERRGPVRPSLVRQRLAEHFAARFPFARVAYFSDHPSLSRKARADALASRP
jgi:lipoyl(octanoyl) transferase